MPFGSLLTPADTWNRSRVGGWRAMPAYLGPSTSLVHGRWSLADGSRGVPGQSAAKRGGVCETSSADPEHGRRSKAQIPRLAQPHDRSGPSSPKHAQPNISTHVSLTS